jgi:hypothetical protein
MPKPNENFHLTVEELQLIEMSLITYSTVQTNRQKEIQKLLAKFYHQKVWYRPPDEKTYVSG